MSDAKETVSSATVRWSLHGRVMIALTWLLLAISCAPPLYLHFLPMLDLPQYVAASSILMHLSDLSWGLAPYYEVTLAKAPAVLSLYLLGGIAQLSSIDVATRVVVFLSVALYPLGLCALLRAQRKPIALALLGAPLVYASPFYWGLLPSSLSAGLALLAVALLVSGRNDRGSRIALLTLATLLPFTHPFGVIIVLGYVASAALTREREDPTLPWLWLSPLFLGGLYWAQLMLHTHPIAPYTSPSSIYRALQLQQEISGGFNPQNEFLLIAAQIALWIFVCRRAFPWSWQRLRGLSHAERALYLFVTLCVLGYFFLPASTTTSVIVNQRAGVLGLALLPALVPRAALSALPSRTAALLLALAASAAWHTTTNLVRFDAEAAAFTDVLELVPWRPKLVGMIYDKTGHVATGIPYMQFPAYAQAERGGLLALTLADVAWTVPLRRREHAPALPPPYGAEWEPGLLHVQPTQFQFYDTVLVRGKEPREMTLFMDTPFHLVRKSGDWMLYVR